MNLSVLKRSAIFRDIGAYVPSTIVPIVTALGSLLIFVRLMSPEIYGEYVIAIATVNITVQFFSEWLSTTTLRLYGEVTGDEEGSVTILSALIVCLGGELILCNLVVVASLLFYNQTSFLASSCVLTTLMTIGRFTTSILRAEHNKRLFVWTTAGAALLGFLASIAFLSIFRRPELVLAGASVGVAIQLFPFLMRVPRKALRAALRGDVSRERVREILSFGMPVMLSGVGAQLLTFADRFMLAKMSGTAAAGLYTANYSIGEKAIGMAFAPICVACYPLVVRAWSENNFQEAGKVLQHASRLYLIYAIPACIVLTIFGRQIAERVLTPAFAGAYGVIPLVAFGLVAWNLGTMFHFGLEMKKKPLYITGMVIAAAILNIVLNLFWIPRYGALGAGWATFLSYLAYSVMAWVINARVVNFNWFPWGQSRVIPLPEV